MMPSMKSFTQELLKVSALADLMESPVVKKLKYPAMAAGTIGAYEAGRAGVKRLIENQRMAEAMRDQMSQQGE
jgi:hypothetical protein